MALSVAGALVLSSLSLLGGHAAVGASGPAAGTRSQSARVSSATSANLAAQALNQANAQLAGHGGSTLVASKARPRASLSYLAVRDGRGRLVVQLSSNAKKVTITYRKGKARSKTVKLRRGVAQVTVPAGATRAKAKAKATKRLRASKKIALVPTLVTPKPTPPTPPTPTPPAPPPLPRGSVRIVSLPPFGPASPSAPPLFRWYEATRTMSCDLIGVADPPPTDMPAGQLAMFASLAQLCRNLTGQGGVVDWTAAASALQQTAGESDCLVLAARSLLGAAVAAHEADPTAPLAAGPASAGTACPADIDEVFVSNPTPGGEYTLNVAGSYLIDVTGASVGGVPLDLFESAEDFDAVPPRGTLSASGSTCLRATVPATVTVFGPGYQASGALTPTVDLGACTP